MEAVTVLNALANEVRLRCVALLASEGELCVCELTHALGLPQPQVSKHLASLRQAGLVSDRREGLWIHYAIHPNLEDWKETLVWSSCDAAQQSDVFKADREALRTMPDRPGGRCAA